MVSHGFRLQLDDFNWMSPADDRVGGWSGPELQVDLPDIEYDVYDVVPDAFPFLWSLKRDLSGVVAASFMTSSRSSEMYQAGPSYAPSALLLSGGSFLCSFSPAAGNIFGPCIGLKIR